MKNKLILTLAAFVGSLGLFFSIPTNNNAQIYAQEIIPNGAVDVVASEAIPLVQATSVLESSYRIDEHFLQITDNQSSLGLCWTFATSEMLETFLAVNFGEMYDFSEAWASLAYKKFTDSYSGTFEINGGGNWQYYQKAINAYGIMLECDLPYDKAFGFTDENYQTYFDYYYNFASKPLINNVVFGTYGDYNYQNKDTIMYNIKDYIKHIGSMYISIDANDLQTDYYGNHYVCSTTAGTNHAVSLIGWDDTFSAGGHTGAWIALNSWGYGSEDEYIYIMYDDVNTNTNVAIKTLVYNGQSISVADVLKDNTLLLKESNSNYVNSDFTPATATLQKNIFSYSENFLPSLTYEYFDIINPAQTTVKVYKNLTDVTHLFRINYGGTFLKLEGESYDAEWYGVYKVVININGNEYVKQFFVKTGAELGSVITSYEIGASIYTSQPAFSFNALNASDVLITNLSDACIWINVGKYSNITDIECNEATVINDSLTSATQSAHAEGFKIFFIDNFASNPTLTFEIKTLDGNRYNYIVYVNPESVNDVEEAEEEVFTILYDTAGGVNAQNNKDIIVLSKSDSGDKYYLSQPQFVEGKIFAGWYYDKNCTRPLPYDSEGYYLSYESINAPSGVDNSSVPVVNSTVLALYAKAVDEPVFNITFDSNGAVGQLDEVSIYEGGLEPFIIPDANSGLTFDGKILIDWKVEGEEIYLPLGQQYSLAELKDALGVESGNITLVANWAWIDYSILLDYNGGLDVNSEASNVINQTIEFNNNLVLPQISRTGYTLSHWVVKNVSIGEVQLHENSYMITELASLAGCEMSSLQNIELKAYWNAKVFDIEYYINGTQTDVEGAQTHTYDQSTALPQLTEAGYTYNAWYLTEELSGERLTQIDAQAFTDNSQPIKLYASRAVQQCQVVLGIMQDNEKVNLPEPVIQEMTYGSVFDINNSYGLDAEIYRPVVDGLDFEYTGKWYTADGELLTENLTIINDTYLYVQWSSYLSEGESYTITFDVNTGSGTIDDQIITSNMQTFLAPDNNAGFSKNGYSLVQWQIGSSDVYLTAGQEYPVNILKQYFDAENIITLKAIWQENSYDITFDFNGGENALGQTSEILSGKLSSENVTLITSDNGVKTHYVLTKWAVAGTQIELNPGDEILVRQLATYQGVEKELNAQITLVAVWTPYQYEIILDVSNDDFITLIPDLYYTVESSNVTLPIYERDGFKLYWKVTDVSAGGTWIIGTEYFRGNLSLTEAMHGDVVMQSVWKANSYNVKFNANGGSGDETLKTRLFTDSFVIDKKSIFTSSYFKQYYYIEGLKVGNNSLEFDTSYLMSELLDFAGLDVNADTSDTNAVIEIDIIWHGNEYKINYYIAPSTLVALTPEYHVYGTQTTLPDMTSYREGYDYDCWHLAGVQGDKVNKLEANGFTSEINLYAIESAQDKTIHLHYRLHGENQPQEIKSLTLKYDASFDITNLHELETPESSQFVYTFTGNWYDITGNVLTENMLIDRDNIHLYAEFSAETRYYTVTFFNYDNMPLLTLTDVTWNSPLIYTGIEPQKPSTVQYDYSFDGWTAVNDENAVKLISLVYDGSFTNLYAHFDKTIVKYNYAFYVLNDENQPEIYQNWSNTVNYGTKLIYTDFMPQKAPTNELSFVFAGWYDSPALEGQPVWYSEDLAGDIPRFEITGETKLYAKFNAITRHYNLKFYTADKVEPIHTEPNLAYTEKFDITGITAEKAPTATEQYEFVGWYTKNGSGGDWGLLVELEASAEISTEYFARFNPQPREYEIEFYVDLGDENGFFKGATKIGGYGTNLVAPIIVASSYGLNNTYNKEYVFYGWYDNQALLGEQQKEFVVSDKKLKYYGYFALEIRKYVANLTVNGQAYNSLTFTYGDEAIDINEVLQQPQSIYTKETESVFVGWFTKDGSESGDWGNEVTTLEVTNEVDSAAFPTNLYAKFVDGPRTYKVMFETSSSNSSVSSFVSANIQFGNEARYSEVSPDGAVKPSKISPDTVYTFLGWSKVKNSTNLNDIVTTLMLNAENITEEEVQSGEIRYYPIYSAEERLYTIRLYNSMEEVFKVLYKPYAEEVDLIAYIPEQKNSNGYSYTFVGWYVYGTDTEITKITVNSDIDLLAHYEVHKILVDISPETVKIMLIAGGSILGLVVVILVIRLALVNRSKLNDNKTANSNIREVRRGEEEVEKQKEEIAARIRQIEEKRAALKSGEVKAEVKPKTEDKKPLSKSEIEEKLKRIQELKDKLNKK